MSFASLTPVVAHQGGWDEIAMVLAPLALLFGILLLANRRARALADARTIEAGTRGDTGPGALSESDGEGPGTDTARP